MTDHNHTCEKCGYDCTPVCGTQRARKYGGRCREPDCPHHGRLLVMAWQLLEGQPLSRRSDVHITDAKQQGSKHRKLALEDPEHCAWHLRQSARARFYGEFPDLRGDINRETDHREAAR